MEFLQNKLVALFLRFRTNGALFVIYALAVEALIIGYVFFSGLFTVETLLPTFVTVRFSLTKFFFILILGTILSSLLGRFLNLSFSSPLSRKTPLLWFGTFWGSGILLISLIKFPPLLIPVIIALFLLSGYLFWNILFEEK